MRNKTPANITALVFAGAMLTWAGSAQANNGYFQIGYGIRSVGMGGVAYAMTKSGMTGANNPATAAFTDDQFDLGLYLFVPGRSSQRQGNVYGLNGNATSRSTLFPIPEFGFNYHVGNGFTAGLTLYGNGGLDTAYPDGQIPAGHCGPGAPAGNLLCGNSTLGVDLTQFVIAPTLAYQVSPNFSVGVAPQFAIQQFTAYGLQAFSGVSASPGNVSERGFSYSYGGGVRFGAYLQATPAIGLGLTYQTPIWCTKFDKYRGLFAGHGSFDIPGSLGAGVSWHVTDRLLLGGDYERIFYSDIPAIANSSASPYPLGDTHGPGFGWRSINVFKAGLAYDVTPALTLRSGYDYGGNPISRPNVTFNILAPGVTQHHLTAGASYHVSPHSQFTLSYAHSFENSLSGPTSGLLPGGGKDTIRLETDELGLAYEQTF